MAIVIQHSTITGIHKTMISSHQTVSLSVEKDYSIPHIDPLCMKVMFPMHVVEGLEDRIVWPRNPEHKRFQDQHVEDFLGQKVGNVPANLARFFMKFIPALPMPPPPSHPLFV